MVIVLFLLVSIWWHLQKNPNVLPRQTLPLIKEVMAAKPEKMLYFRNRKLQCCLSVMLSVPESKQAMCLWIHGLPTSHLLQIFWQRVWMLSVCSRTINSVIFTKAKSTIWNSLENWCLSTDREISCFPFKSVPGNRTFP